MKYPATLMPDDNDGGFVVTFRDIPEAITQGDTVEEALTEAASALLSAMDFYFEDKRPVPLPSKPQAGERLVALPLSASAKVLLLNEMLAQKIGPSELARRMGTSPQEVNRIIDLNHATKIDRVNEAMEAVGKEIELSVA